MPRQDRCLVMGVVNVTPDSFSDGGAWFGADSAIEHGLDLVAQGADIVDVGGESTRPGAQRIDAEEELRRVGPVIRGLVAAGVYVSIDTMRAKVAEFALEAGAHLVNDVSGGLADPDMPRLVAQAAVPYVVMHWRGYSSDMYARATYHDVVTEVRDELARRVDEVTKAGVSPECIVLDPGLGFGKRAEHNWPLLTHLSELAVLRGHTFPVLIGASRKGFIGKLLAGQDGTPRPFAGSDDATVAMTALAAANGAWCVRVHQVTPNADAVRVAAAWKDATLKPDIRTSGAPRLAVLAIGANLGDRLGTLRQAVSAVSRLPATELVAKSPVYETAPVGGPAQPDYLNAVLIVTTGLRPRDLLAALNAIEDDFGRVREVRFGPRTLDIDIISYSGETSDDPVLTLPHPRAHERAFVLAPWHDIDPGAVLPSASAATPGGSPAAPGSATGLPSASAAVPGGSVAGLLAAADRTGLRRLPDAL